MKIYKLFLLLFFAAAGTADAQIKEISLEACLNDSFAYSNELKQLKEQANSAKAQYKNADSAYYPSINLEAKGSWVSEVPELQTGNAKIAYGDNWGYSVGPTLEYLLFDYGGRGGASKSAQASYQAAIDELALAEKNLILNVRQAYFTVQQDLENMYFMAEQLKVAQKQLKDVNSAFKAGAKSSLDVSMAQKQELRSQINISNARGMLGVHLRELFQFTGNSYGIDPSYPADWRITVTKDDEPASSVIKAQALEETLNNMQKFSRFKFDENSHRLLALENTAKYYEYMAQSLKSSLYPTLGLSGGAYWEYPNGPIKENTFVARAGLALKFPLFEGSKTKSKSQAQQSLALATQYQKAQAYDNLQKLFNSSKSLLQALDLQTKLTQKMIAASAKSAELTYQAYSAGTVTFLEVDNANLGLLESRIALSDIYIECLNRLAVLDSLGKEDL